jgi:phage shock protein E
VITERALMRAPFDDHLDAIAPHSVARSTHRRSPASVLAVLVLALAGCTGGEVSEPTASMPVATRAELLNPADFAAAIADPGRVTINVHTPNEGQLPGTDSSLPFDQIQQQVAALPPDRTTPLAIYCRTGTMSATAAKELAALGYTDVVELQGGMLAWRNTGRTIEE